jgi:hypothetical protein
LEALFALKFILIINALLAARRARLAIIGVLISNLSVSKRTNADAIS